MLKKLISKILIRLGKPPPWEEEYQYTDCIGFWIDSYNYDEYDDDEYDDE